MNKIDKSTMEGILTIENDDSDDINEVFTKQLVCLKQACLCLDKVTDMQKENLMSIMDRTTITETNIFTLTDSLNHVLERLRSLEDKIKMNKNETYA